MKQIERIFPIFEELKATHLPAKLGLAVLPKLCKLVRFVIVENRTGNTEEADSLRYLLEDLHVHLNPYSDPVPHLLTSQYFRTTKPSDFEGNVDELKPFDGSVGLGHRVEDEIQKLLTDTGWSDVLMKIFQPSMNDLQ